MERLPNKYRERDYEITISSPEFTCLCPMTSQPDFAEIVIHYMPDEYIVELKSLKLYFHSYRNKGIFHEEAVNTILSDFVETIQPKHVDIVGNFKVRGGIYTTVKASHTKQG